MLGVGRLLRKAKSVRDLLDLHYILVGMDSAERFLNRHGGQMLVQDLRKERNELIAAIENFAEGK